MFLPRALSTLTDAQTAVRRLEPVSLLPLSASPPGETEHIKVFETETTDLDRPIQPNANVALRLEDVTFQWGSLNTYDQAFSNLEQANLKSDGMKHEKTEAFVLEDISMVIPRGWLVALVGRVGSGKSSLLQGVSAGLRWLGLQSDHWGNDDSSWRNGDRWTDGVLSAKWQVLVRSS